jgi:hypothetical protein
MPEFNILRTITRQDAFAALIESLRREAPASKPMAIAGVDSLDETHVQEEPLEISCQNCGGNGLDSSSWDPFGEICSHCHGSGHESVTESPVSVSEPAIARREIVSIGPGMFVRTGRRRS